MRVYPVLRIPIKEVIMRIWIMANDKDERTTTLKEYFMAKPQVRDFVSAQKHYHQRNGVKIKTKIFKGECTK